MTYQAEQEELDLMILDGTAYHEAGHAVAMLKGRIPTMTKKISIVPSPDFRGYTECDFEFKPDSKPDLATVEYNVTVLLAGLTSERNIWLFTAGLRRGSRTDIEKARQWLVSIAPEKKERQALMRSIAAKTKRLVETHWPSIEAVAEALLVEKVMDGDRFMDIVGEVKLLQS